MSQGASTTIDPAEVARFERIAETWWDPKGPMRVLHRFNPVRLAYVRDEASLTQPTSSFVLPDMAETTTATS